MEPELKEIAAHVSRRLPAFRWDGRGERLPGGLLNYVWRLSGLPRSVVVKMAPPYVAAAPHLPLDPGRSRVEAAALSAFEPRRGALAAIRVPGLRPPRLLDADAESSTLLLEDLGSLPDLGALLVRGISVARRVRRIGRFVGRLHARTYGREELARRFDNRAMQQARHEIQYRAVGAACGRAGLADAARLGRIALELGLRLQGPGSCVVMGDLWPASVLVKRSRLYLIDWELAHFGNPAQDVAHFAAHLWMHAHRATTRRSRSAARTALRAFREGYLAQAGHLLTPEILRDCAVHFGAELLTRAIGPFQDGFLYDGLPPRADAVQEAVRCAAVCLRSGRFRRFGPGRRG